MRNGLMVPLLVVFVATPMVGCQPGHMTEDRRYVGDPERPAATSEPIRDTDDDPGEPGQTDH